MTKNQKKKHPKKVPKQEIDWKVYIPLITAIIYLIAEIMKKI